MKQQNARQAVHKHLSHTTNRPTIYTQNKSSFLLCSAEAEVHTPPQASERAKKETRENKRIKKREKRDPTREIKQGKSQKITCEIPIDFVYFINWVICIVLHLERIYRIHSVGKIRCSMVHNFFFIGHRFPLCTTQSRNSIHLYMYNVFLEYRYRYALFWHV